MMRISKYIRTELQNAALDAFGNATVLLFGSRTDKAKRGGDFDIAIKSSMDKETFRKGKVKFFKYLFLKDLDLPIDLVHYEDANKLLKREIDKGSVLSF